eukprot:635672_1
MRLLAIVLWMLQLCRNEAEFVFVPTPALFDAAEGNCQSTYSGHLASIHSQADNEVVKEVCENIGQFQSACLMGLDNRYPLSKWSDDTSIDYSNWYPGEPDARGAQPIVSIRQGGDWHTIGSIPLPYVCEYETTAEGKKKNKYVAVNVMDSESEYVA